MPNCPRPTKSLKRLKVERAFAMLPLEVQKRILAFVYAATFGRRSRADELSQFRKVVLQHIK